MSNLAPRALMVMLLLALQSVLAALLLLPEISQDVARSIHSLVYPTNPALAQQLYAGYLAWYLPVAVISISGATAALVGIAVTGGHPLMLIMGIIYASPINLLVLAGVVILLIAAIYAVLALAAIILGVLLGIGAMFFGFWVLGQSLK